MILLIYRTKTTTFPQCQPSKHQCFPAGKVLILLMDDRMILGTLRLFDKLANIVLQRACERVIVGDLYCDISLGLYYIQAVSIDMIGELDIDKEDLPPHITRVSEAEIKQAQKVEREANELRQKTRKLMQSYP
ncbi:sm-like protein LSM1B [Beta vulgaris subsp. vulgaris]|uniref:sm-like protein LSM1B n=1 Tax=Beta vulgaris subsp. vulgaris TaxID=3555 RepID=UPI0020372709|nr:sm-like protein LSM1B [Beta vulgaris subsp. vulgaris]